MIVEINNSNRQLYNDFFIESYKFAKENNLLEPEDMNQDAFTSLWQFYQYLPKLGAANPVYYTKLPLDEGMAVIDGDSRDIEVPNQFKICAGIQNDHMAESIMFIIDRYHDGKDLSNAQIWVQWKASNGSEGKVQVPHKDTNFEQNKIRFPWPLTEEVTKNTGTIEFSVVFFMMKPGENNVAYRYATLPKVIKIAPALLPDLGNDAIDVGGNFAVAVKTSDYGPGFYLPANPSFINTQKGLNLVDFSNLNYDSTDLNDKGTLTLKAQATVSDSGIISYTWGHRVPDEVNGLRATQEFECGQGKEKTIASGTILNSFEINFINEYSTTSVNLEEKLDNDGKLSEDLKIIYNFGTIGIEKIKIEDKALLNSFDRYYNDENEALTLTEAEDAIDNERGVYEIVSTFTLPEDGPVTGYYFATAQNKTIAGTKTVYKEDGTTIDKTETVYKYSEVVRSNSTLLKSPEQVTITNTNAVTAFFDPDTKKVSLNTDLEKKSDESYVINLYTNKLNDSISTNENSVQAIEIKSDATTVPFIELDKEEHGIGWYQAVVTARKNRETKSENTKVWRVVNPVEAPQIVNTTSTGDVIYSISQDQDEGEKDIYKVTVKSNKEFTLSVGIKDELAEGNAVALGDYYRNKDGRVVDLISDKYYCIWEKQIADGNTEKLQESDSSSYIYKNGIGNEERVSILCTFVNMLKDQKKTSQLCFDIIS